jgi:hypothetical protein
MSLQTKIGSCWLCSRIWKEENKYDCETTHITIDNDNNFYLNIECAYSGQIDDVRIHYCPMCGAELKKENYNFEQNTEVSEIGNNTRNDR